MGTNDLDIALNSLLVRYANFFDAIINLLEINSP